MDTRERQLLQYLVSADRKWGGKAGGGRSNPYLNPAECEKEFGEDFDAMTRVAESLKFQGLVDEDEPVNAEGREWRMFKLSGLGRRWAQ